MARIKIAIVGIGNCASALVQGIHYYRNDQAIEQIGLMHRYIGGYLPGDLEVVAAFDIDRRKVGVDLNQAVFAAPNCTEIFQPKLPASKVTVAMGPVFDGVPPHMVDYEESQRFLPADLPEPDGEQVVAHLRDSGAAILVNFLPVGAQQATEFYMKCALEAHLAVVNCIPVFIASTPKWSEQFNQRGLPLIGDDIKSQLGATIVHRTLTDLFRRRGVKLTRTYQLNTGGNTDFLNMLDHRRLATKKQSKTEAVQAVAQKRLADADIHIGPSDYVPWQRDNKVGFIRMEGLLFGQIPMNLEMRLSVEDSPNSAGVVIDAVRCAQLALDRGQAGVLDGPSACFCKHPPHQLTDDEAWHEVENFIGTTVTTDSPEGLAN